MDFVDAIFLGEDGTSKNPDSFIILIWQSIKCFSEINHLFPISLLLLLQILHPQMLLDRPLEFLRIIPRPLPREIVIEVNEVIFLISFTLVVIENGWIEFVYFLVLSAL